MLIVDETLSALGRFATWHRERIDSLIIGVTGSVGKTTDARIDSCGTQQPVQRDSESIEFQQSDRIAF